jgi:hypothetical protein
MINERLAWFCAVCGRMIDLVKRYTTEKPYTKAESKAMLTGTRLGELKHRLAEKIISNFRKDCKR